MKIQSAAVYTYERIVASLEAYRLFNPMTHANMQINRGIVEGEFSTAAIKESDVVVFQREFPVNLSNYLAVMAQSAALGKPVVMDMDDDLLGLPVHHPDRIKLNYAKAQIPILTGMIQATALTVTTPYLADLLRKYNSNIFILPNFLDDSLWKFNAPQVDPVGEKIRIFFMGTVTHVPDLEMLKPAFRALALKYPGRLEFVFYGANLKFDEAIPATITNCQSETFVFADYVQIALAQKANIAIAPLEDIPYNHCKSSIKFFEYSAIGLPGVYSRVTPYTSVIEEGVNGFTASTISEWIESLSQLIENPQLRETMALAAQETVRRDWLLSDHAFLWPETYTQIAELKSPNQSSIATYLPVLEDIYLHLDTFFKNQTQKDADLSWQLSLKDQELTGITKDNTVLHARIESLSQDNAELRDRVDDLRVQWIDQSRQLSLKDQELTGISRDNTVLHASIESLSQDNAELRDRVDDLRVQWIDQSRQIQALESENHFIEQAWHESKLEVVDYALSTSWRLTRPLRKFTKIFKGK